MGVASLVVERFRAPSGTRDARALDSARKRIVTALAGRTVWCASAHSEGGASARRLRGYLAWADGDGVAAAWCELPDTGDAGSLVADVQPDDVVVLHDPLTAAPAEAIRARGGHAVWQVGGPRDRAPAVDAYVMATRTPDGGYRVAALMPWAGIMAVKEVRSDAYRDVGWSSLLADVVRSDRSECVGGTLHARPTVAPR
jgi:hypothetical protein